MANKVKEHASRVCRHCGGVVQTKQSRICNHCKNYPDERKMIHTMLKLYDKFLGVHSA